MIELKDILGTYKAYHRDWQGVITLKDDGTFVGGGTNPDGKYEFNDGVLTLNWHHWEPEKIIKTNLNFHSNVMSLYKDINPLTEIDLSITLLVGAYYEANQNRREEFLCCIRKNIENKYISEIRIFAEDDRIKEYLKEFYDIPKVKIIDHGKRLTFQFLFKYSNDLLYGKIVMISNSDIWFDETLSRIYGQNISEKLLCLKRTEPDGTIFCLGEDSWLFVSPLTEFKCDWNLGVLYCEKTMQAAAAKVGIDVFIPKVIVAHHAHASMIRTYSNNERIEGDELFPRISISLSDVIN